MCRNRLGDSEFHPDKQREISGQCAASIRTFFDSVPRCLGKGMERGTTKSGTLKLFSIGTIRDCLPSFCNGIWQTIFKWRLASEARQAEGKALVGKYGWEVWVCGQARRFASLSTYPGRPPTYPSRESDTALLPNSSWDNEPKGKLTTKCANIS